MDVDCATGAAWRRRQRRLRSWWRHGSRRWLESWPRTSTTVPHGDRGRPGRGESARRTTRLCSGRCPPRQLVAQHFAMDAGEELGRHQPPGGQHRCLRCCRRSGFSSAPQSRSSTLCFWSPLLHDVVPHMVEQLVDILAPLDFRVAEQVIEVPKIVCPPRAARTVLRAPQTADQLVEVPTIISYSSLLQRTMEQNVAIPVPLGRGGRNADLPGFLRGQGPTAQSSSLERISEQIMEQIADIPVARGDLHGFRPGQSSSSIAHSPAAWLNTEDEPFQGVFRTFSPREKCDRHPAHGCESAAARQLMHVVCLWPAHLGGRRHGWGLDVAYGSGARLVVVQLVHAPLPVAPAVGALCLAVGGAGGRPCAHAETWFACSSPTWLTCPWLCIAKCAVFAVMSLPPLSWRSGRFLWSVPEILLLQHNDKVVVILYVQSCGRQSSSHSCSLDKVVDMPVVFNVQKTAVAPQLSRVFLVADVPGVQVVLVPLSAAVDALWSCSDKFSLQQLRCSDSFIARVLWTSCCAREKGTRLQPCWLW